MENTHINQTSTRDVPSKGGFIAGVLLVLIGAGILIFRLLGLPGLFPLFLGLGFLVTGCLTRNVGFIIPGGIVSGVGLGILSLESQVFGALSEPADGAVFLLSFSLGWFLIPVFSRLFTRETSLWALIPGGVLAGVGGLILAGEAGLKVLETFGNLSPILLVIIGAALLVGYYRKNRAK